jgi:hypothetical protein
VRACVRACVHAPFDLPPIAKHQCGQDQFCDMPDADPTLSTHPAINQSAMNYQDRRVGTKMVAHGWPQQHSKLVLLSKLVEIQCKNRFGKLINGPN